MKKTIAIAAICILMLVSAPTAHAQDVNEIPQEKSNETIIGIETYSKADYTGWLALEVTVKDSDTKEPLSGVIVSLVNVKTGEHSGTGPAVDEPNPPGFFPMFGQSRAKAAAQASTPPVTGSNGQFMTDDNGQIVFRMYPSPDQYRIEVRQSGYADYVSEPFELQNHGYTEVHLQRPQPEPSPQPSPEPSPQASPEPSPQASPEQPAPPQDGGTQGGTTPSQGVGPKTGDTSELWPSLLAALASAAALVAALLYRKKRAAKKT